MDLIGQVRDALDRHGLLHPGDTVVVGVSGGPDSLCLLHVLRQLAPEYGVALQVGHLHHGIRGPEADQDAEYVAALCRAWELACTVERADVPAQAREFGLALEEAARRARYAFLGALARCLGGGSVAVAHNADDQVETVLMHLLRGAGLAGLRGMRPLAWLDELRLGPADGQTSEEPRERIHLLRPLLGVARQDIEAYCAEHDLRPRFDRSNLDTTYYRNRLRHELIPALESYNPNLRAVVRRTAEVLAGDYDLLRGLLLETWPTVVRQESDQAIVYDLATLRALPLGLQRSVLREGIHRLRASLRNISWVHVDDAVEILRTGRTGAVATLPQGLALTLGYAEALLASEGYRQRGEDRPRIVGCIAVPVPGAADIPGSRWTVETRLVARLALPLGWERNPDPYLAYLDAARLAFPLTLRGRRVGDRFVPLGLDHHQKVSDFMINQKIPRHERDAVPLLVSGDDILWVVGWHPDARYALSEDTAEVLVVRAQPPPHVITR